MLRITLLGTIRLSTDGPDDASRDIPLPPPKPLALLAYLAATAPGVRRRDELLGLLWPELDSSRGRRSLSQALFVLRNALGADAVITHGNEDVGVDDQLLWCDVVALRKAFDAGKSEEALSIYQGDCLPGFFVSDAPEFERWVEEQRATLRTRAVSAATDLAHRDERSGKIPAALGWARRALALAPFDETALRRNLELLDLVGDRAGAIQTYTEFATALERELGVRPSAETEAQIRRIRSREETHEPSPAASASKPHELPSAHPTPAVSVTIGSAPLESAPFRAARSRTWTRLVAALAGGAGLTAIALALIAQSHSGALAGNASAKPAMQREQILIADFDAAASDSALAAAVTEAVRLDVAQSPLIRVTSAGAIQQALQRMRRDGVQHIDSTIAREIAVRDGVKGVLAGDVRHAGGGFILSARLVNAADGGIVRGWREVARDSSEILAALDRLSRAVRAHAGESLESIRDATPPLRVTTTSLEALQYHAMGTRAYRAGEYRRAVDLFEQAVRLDSAFAEAWVSLTNALATLDVRPGRQSEAVIRAYALRDRLPAWERFEVDGFYEARVRNDLLAAITAFQNHAEIEPIEAWWAYLGSLQLRAGQPAQAERVLRHAIEVSPTTMQYFNLSRALFALGKDSAARAAIATGLDHYPNNTGLEHGRIELTYALGDVGAADSLAHSFPADGGDRFPTMIQAGLDALHGKLTEADAHLRRIAAARDSSGLASDALSATIDRARIRLHVANDTASAIALVDHWLGTHRLSTIDARERPYGRLAHFFAEADRPARSEELIREYERVVPKEYRIVYAPVLARARAVSAMTRGDALHGVAMLRDAGAGEVWRTPEFGTSSGEMLIELAHGYERLGLKDSALVMYNRYLGRTYTARIEEDGLFLANALVRAGRLEEEHGRIDAAIRNYERVTSLWQASDPPIATRRQVLADRVPAMRACNCSPVAR